MQDAKSATPFFLATLATVFPPSRFIPAAGFGCPCSCMGDTAGQAAMHEVRRKRGLIIGKTSSSIAARFWLLGTFGPQLAAERSIDYLRNAGHASATTVR
jgi:hypothetical protein